MLFKSTLSPLADETSTHNFIKGRVSAERDRKFKPSINSRIRGKRTSLETFLPSSNNCTTCFIQFLEHSLENAPKLSNLTAENAPENV